MGFWNRPHQHQWYERDFYPVSVEGKTTAQILTYRCYGCGSIRYDKIDGNGFVSSTVTDANGNVIKVELDQI